MAATVFHSFKLNTEFHLSRNGLNSWQSHHRIDGVVKSRGYTLVSCFRHSQSELEFIRTCGYYSHVSWEQKSIPFHTKEKSKDVSVFFLFRPVWNGYSGLDLNTTSVRSVWLFDLYHPILCLNTDMQVNISSYSARMNRIFSMRVSVYREDLPLCTQTHRSLLA